MTLDQNQNKSISGHVREFLVNPQVGVMGFATAVIIGQMFSKLIRSMSKDLIMPFLNLLLAKKDWVLFIIPVFGAKVRVGSFLSELVSFLVTFLIVVFLIEIVIGKWIVGEQVVKQARQQQGGGDIKIN